MHPPPACHQSSDTLPGKIAVNLNRPSSRNPRLLCVFLLVSGFLELENPLCDRQKGPFQTLELRADPISPSFSLQLNPRYPNDRPCAPQAHREQLPGTNDHLSYLSRHVSFTRVASILSRLFLTRTASCSHDQDDARPATTRRGMSASAAA